MSAPRVRYRIMLWLNASGNPEQVAVGRWIGDDKITESTYEPAPFDTPSDCVDLAVHALDIQLEMPYNVE